MSIGNQILPDSLALFPKDMKFLHIINSKTYKYSKNFTRFRSGFQ